MGARIGRVAGIAAVVVIAFTVPVAIFLRVFPGTRTSTDYLVIGTVSTFISMIFVFLLLTRNVQIPGRFFRSRK